MELGHWYRDRITGFEGLATEEREYLNGCVQFTLEPGLNADGELTKGERFDVQQLEEDTSKGVSLIKPAPYNFELGGKVVDRITGYEGTVTARSRELGATPQVAIQPFGLKKDGSSRESYWFSDDRVAAIPEGAPAGTLAPIKKPSGGTQPEKNARVVEKSDAP